MITLNIISIASFCFVFQVFTVAAYDDNLVVQLPKGAIRGRSRTSDQGIEYYTYQDIPFASPPIGEDRFKVPKPPKSWNGILDATDNVKECIQSMGPRSALFDFEGASSQSEDCLYLNVYTPVKPGNNASLAVFVFIHGGGYIGGNNWYSSYGPKYLIDHEIVIVTINYRLGVLGFLSTNDGVIPGNLALKDQHLALKWVQENIRLFGGDPNKVTVDGISAGSSSVGYQLLSQQNKGLFRGIILQSGTSINTWGFQKNPESYAFKVGNMLDNTIGYTNSSKLLSVLLKVSVNDLVQAAEQVPNEDNIYGSSTGDLIWCPSIEKTGSNDDFISESMYDSLENGKFNQVPIMLGFSSEEALQFVNDDEANKFSELFDNDPSLLVNDKFHLDAKNKDVVGNELRNLYTANTSFSKNLSALVTYLSDNFMTRSTNRHAEITSRYVPTYLYKFSYSNTPSRYPGTERLGHSEEMRFIWEKTYSRDTTDFDSVIRQRAVKLWTNFVKYLDPTPSKDPLLQNIIWPKVESGNIKYLNIDETLSIASNPRQYNEVSAILDKYVQVSSLDTY